MAWLDDIATELINAGVATSGMILFSSKSKVPSGPGPYITLNATGGGNPRDTHNQALAYRFPGAQILTRATGHVVARDKAIQLLLVLGVVRNKSINGTFYRAIHAMQSEPFDMGLDDTNERIVMAFNVLGDRRA